MVSFSTESKRNLAFLGIAILVLLSAVVVTHQIFFDESRNGSASDSNPHGFGVNSSGLTYGSMLYVENPSEKPDLIAVEATNGQSGFVFREDFENADGLEFATPEELMSHQLERDREAAKVFADLIESNLRIAALSLSDDEKLEILEFARMMHEWYSSEEEEIAAGEAGLFNALYALGSTNDEIADSLTASSLSSNYRIFLDRHIVPLWHEAEKSTNIVIPVYDSEGKTIVGEFEIGF